MDVNKRYIRIGCYHVFSELRSHNVRSFPCNFSSRAIPIPKATPLIIWLRVWEAAIFRIPLGDR
jgi:hypothetical protein